MSDKKVRIAHLAGPNATITNTPPLVTSNKARAQHGLPMVTDIEASRCGSTCCVRKRSPRRSQSMSNSSPLIRWKAMLPTSTPIPMDIWMRPARSTKPASRRRTSRSSRSSSIRRTGTIHALHGAPEGRFRLGERHGLSVCAAREEPPALHAGRQPHLRGNRPARCRQPRLRQHTISSIADVDFYRVAPPADTPKAFRRTNERMSARAISRLKWRARISGPTARITSTCHRRA